MTPPSPEQYPLPLDHRPALGRADFLVGPSNAEAVAWLDRWPDWPAVGLVLYGPKGCGKTHLAQVFATRSQAPGVQGEPGLVLDPPALLAHPSPAVVVDDADRGLDQTGLFHLINSLKEAGRTLLLTASAPPNLWPGLTLPDLRSRLLALPAVRIGPPDDAVMGAVLIKLFADRQLRVGTEVITYLLRHMERSHAAALEVVAAADHVSLASHRPITIPLIKEIL